MAECVVESHESTRQRSWKRRCFSEPRICVGWPSSPLSSCPKVFLFKARRVCLHCGTWPLFPHARRFSQTWPATGLDPPSTRSQPPQLEFTHLDDEGRDQGNSVGLVQSFTPGAGYMVNLLWIQDMSLKDWLLSDHGHRNPGRSDLARSNSLDLTVTRGEPPVQPIGTWRRLGTYADYSLADVHWARKQKVRPPSS